MLDTSRITRKWAGVFVQVKLKKEQLRRVITDVTGRRSFYWTASQRQAKKTLQNLTTFVKSKLLFVN